MVLEEAIINISRNIELTLSQSKSISSYLEQKEEALSCLKKLLVHAPLTEYQKLLESKNRTIVIGYLLSNLCSLAKSDKSRSIRMKSLSIMSILIDKLNEFHEYFTLSCTIDIIRNVIPGVCSTLFRIIMGDTKQPKDIFVVSLEILAKLIDVNCQTCDHKIQEERPEDEDNKIVENLGIRLVFLIEYIIDHSSELGNPIILATLDLCQIIVNDSRLIRHNLNIIIRFTAFMLSHDINVSDLVSNLRENIDKNDHLDTMLSSSFVKFIENLNDNFETMLPSEREAQISLLSGYANLTSSKSLTGLMELDEVRDILMNLLKNLTKFSKHQSFLFLTDTIIGVDALEANLNRVCKFDKRFMHNLNRKELELIETTCKHLGAKIEWYCLNDILMEMISHLECSTGMFIAQMILPGLGIRSDNKEQLGRFFKQILKLYTEFLSEDQTNRPEIDTIRTIVAIETIVIILDLNMKYNSKAESCRVLHSTLCTLLVCASSTNRFISEVSLGSLAQISHLYGHKSIKELIEANIDYVVDGISVILDNRGIDDQIANVLAITFKLSSKESFFYFKDLFERIFKLVGAYHWHSLKTRSMALLFSRTISILADWKGIPSEVRQPDLNFDSSRSDSLIRQLDIDSWIAKLQTPKVNESFEMDEERIISDLKNGINDLKKDMPSDIKENDEIKSEKQKPKPIEIEITEKILTHSINLASSNDSETKILALDSLARGFYILADEEDILLPLIHKAWSPLLHRLTSDYSKNLEVNLKAFECLLSMANNSRDFIKHRTMSSILPRICLFLESQADLSLYKKEYGPYCTTMNYKCQLIILKNLGFLVFNIELGYKHLWRIIQVALLYLNPIQVKSLYEAAYQTLLYLMATDCDCVWYFAQKVNKLNELPFKMIYDI